MFIHISVVYSIKILWNDVRISFYPICILTYNFDAVKVPFFSVEQVLKKANSFVSAAKIKI